MHSCLLFLTLAFLASNGNAQYIDGSFSYVDSYRQYPSYDYLRPLILANDYYPTQNRLFVGLTNFLQTTTTTTTSTSVVTCTVSTTACARRRRSLTKLEDVDEVIEPTFVNKVEATTAVDTIDSIGRRERAADPQVAYYRDSSYYPASYELQPSSFSTRYFPTYPYGRQSFIANIPAGNRFLFGSVTSTSTFTTTSTWTSRPGCSSASNYNEC